MIHQPFWTLNPSDDRLGPALHLRAIYHDLFVKYDVDMVINGHAHNFYHTVRNGTDYTTSGGGTIDFVGAQPNHPTTQAMLLPEDQYMLEEIHLCLIEVTIEGFNVQVIPSNGTVVFEYLVPAELEITTTTTTPETTTTTTTTTSTTSLDIFSVLIGALCISIIVIRKRKGK